MVSYQVCLEDAMKLLKMSTPNERCEQLARSVFKMKNKYKDHENKKRERSMVVITETPKPIVESKYSGNICQATTMKGKKCSFKATCGGFCKKHAPKKGSDKEVMAFLKK